MTDIVLLDFFGTLVRYEPDRAALTYPASHHLLVGWGWEQSHDEFVELWDEASKGLDARTASSHEEVRMVDYATAFGERCGMALTPGRREELAATFVSEWCQHVRPVDGAPELLEALAGTFRLGIVSNTNDPEMVPRLVATYFSPVLFEETLLSVSHGFRKPHPSIYEAALALFDRDASRAVFVGDSYEADYLGPTAAGVSAFLIDPAGQHPVPDEHRLATILDLPSRL